MRTVLVFAVNTLLLVLSWAVHRVQQGDEYLVLFTLPLVCIAAACSLTMRQLFLLLLCDLLLFIFYSITGILNPVDVTVLMFLLLGASGLSYSVTFLRKDFEKYNKARVSGEEGEYGRIVGELEDVERKGRVVEKELSRISRLYEMTKQFGAVLKFSDLLDRLFGFLENNFQYDRAHLIVFMGGEFSQGVSKSVSGPKEYHSVSGGGMDYRALVNHMNKDGFAPFYAERRDEGDMFTAIGIESDTFLALPLFVRKISAILAVEGASKMGYSRFNIVVPQLALELRKVELYEQVEKLSIIDGLTGTYLRRYLMERLDENVERARRLGLTFSVGMIDIDNFKACNDTYGHLVGDAVLKEVANRLKASVREVDMVARYGGEEFCIILPETPKDLAFSVLERLRESVVETEIRAFDEKIRVTVSAGIATYPEDAEASTPLIDLADTVLYKAKRKGRNRVCMA